MPGLTISVKSDLAQFAREVRGYPADVKKASRIALSRSIRHGRAISARQVKKTYTLDYSSAKVKLMMPTTTGSSRATIKLNANAISLNHFAHSFSKRGVKVSVKKPRQMKLLSVGGIKAFQNVGSKLNSGIFVRKGTSRLPITRLFGPSVAGILHSQSFDTRLKQELAEYYDRNVLSQLERQLHLNTKT